MIKLEYILQCKTFLSSYGDSDNNKDLIVTTDSRSISGKNTFIALYGDRFDAFNFVGDLLSEKNLGCFIIENRAGRSKVMEGWANEYPSKLFIEVSDIYKFILELAEICSKNFKSNGGKIIGLTGSNGKTTNKEMLAYILKEVLGDEKVHFTKGNLNNHIGVPLTVFDIEREHEVAIVEMGTNHPGEIKVLCDAAIPDYGMITNIGHAHIEFLKSLDGVLEEKGNLYKAIEVSKNENKKFILNGFDEKLNTLDKNNWVNVVDKNNTSIENSSFEIKLNNEICKIENESLLGEHQQINMAMCMSMAHSLYPKKLDIIVKAAKSFRLSGMNRGEVLTKEDKKIYLDAYNANPSSMMASIRSFKSLIDREEVSTDEVLLILGDMNEIGDQARILHGQVAEEVHDLGFKNFAFVGKYKDFYRDALGLGDVFNCAKDLTQELRKLAKPRKYIFIKGSRSLQLESILDIYKA